MQDPLARIAQIFRISTCLQRPTFDFHCSIYLLSFTFFAAFCVNRYENKTINKRQIFTMENETSNIEESVLNVTLEDNKVKKEQPKKGISVTRALVMLGFDDWKDLEPGMYEIVIDHLESLNSKIV